MLDLAVGEEDVADVVDAGRRIDDSATAKENRPTQEKFHCVACGHTAHTDTVGALNVLRAGLVRRNANTA